MEQRGTIRRSRRVRERKRREQREGRKSVGDDLGVTPVRGKAVNLAEARAMQDARAAAGAWDDDNAHAHRGKSSLKKKRHSRGRSLEPREKPHAMAGPARKAMSDAGTPRRASLVRNSLSARKRTERIFDSDVEDAEDNADTGDDDMPEFDENHESKTPEPDRKCVPIYGPYPYMAQRMDHPQRPSLNPPILPSSTFLIPPNDLNVQNHPLEPPTPTPPPKRQIF